ncbi:MAG: DUF4139 domain-containing protein [Alphaproteobacteria bacterium]|nr:DUF4139 domain-containing protein [Alphaproteobacteria bacterium]
MMRKVLYTCSALAVLCGAAWAEPAKVAITIYNDDTALVEDVRTLDLQPGRQRLEFPGVSARIRPETAALTGDGIDIVEQNFDFDLLTPSKMMEKAVGSTVQLVRVNPATGRETIETAKVLSANEGVVLKIGDRIEVLRDDGLPVRVLFDKIPENLRAKPTLSVTVTSKTAGARPVALRYLTSGIGWSADYVGVFDEKAGKLDLQGWVTLTNRSGTSYTDAKTQLIAGAPGQAGDAVLGATEGGTGGASDDATSFGDYHLYTLKLPTTIAENQTKQVSFIDAAGVKAQKVYLVDRGGFSSQRTPEGAAVKLRFANDAASGLGAALPAGTLRLYAKDSAGRAQFIGEDELGHVAQGSKLELAIGTAFDVTAQSQVTKRDAPKKGVTVTSITYTFRNARAEPATVLFSQGVNPDNELVESSAPGERVDAGTYAWRVPIPARGETKLSFTVREGREEKPDPK